MCVLGLDPGESKGEPGTRAPPFPLFSTWRPGVLHVDTQAWGGGAGRVVCDFFSARGITCAFPCVHLTV